MIILCNNNMFSYNSSLVKYRKKITFVIAFRIIIKVSCKLPENKIYSNSFEKYMQNIYVNYIKKEKFLCDEHLYFLFK